MVQDAPGPREGTWTEDLACAGCKTSYRANADDVQVDTGTYWGQFPSIYFVLCPKCARKRELEGDGLPEWVRRSAKVVYM